MSLGSKIGERRGREVNNGSKAFRAECRASRIDCGMELIGIQNCCCHSGKTDSVYFGQRLICAIDLAILQARNHCLHHYVKSPNGSRIATKRWIARKVIEPR